MKITKLEHSGLVLEKDGQKLVFDPVSYEMTLPELQNVAAIMITHRHPDHYQSERIAEIRAINPTAQILVPEDMDGEIADAKVVRPGDNLEVVGFMLQIFGGSHAEIIPGKVPCVNLGVMIDEKIVNPGDSFDLLDLNQQNEVLFVPEVAPWCKMSECMEFIRTAQPKVVIPVHDALLSPMGKNIYDNLLRVAVEEVGAEFAALSFGESIER